MTCSSYFFCHCDHSKQMTVCQSVCLDGKYPPIVNDIDLKEEDLSVNGEKRNRSMYTHCTRCRGKNTHTNNSAATTMNIFLQPNSLILKWKYFDLAQYYSELLASYFSTRTYWAAVFSGLYQKCLWDKSSEFFELRFLDDLDSRFAQKAHQQVEPCLN